MGLRNRRGTEAHCRGCGYLLIGIQSSFCPECGREFGPDDVLLGEVRVDGSWVLQGLISILLAFACFWGASTHFIRSFDYYHYWPTEWVLNDASLPARAPALRAWNELLSRRVAGKPGRALEQKLNAFAWVEQAKPPGSWGPLHDEMFEYLAGLICDRKLTSIGSFEAGFRCRCG